jgi:hypothetical protein
MQFPGMAAQSCLCHRYVRSSREKLERATMSRNQGKAASIPHAFSQHAFTFSLAIPFLLLFRDCNSARRLFSCDHPWASCDLESTPDILSLDLLPLLLLHLVVFRSTSPPPPHRERLFHLHVALQSSSPIFLTPHTVLHRGRGRMSPRPARRATRRLRGACCSLGRRQPPPPPTTRPILLQRTQRTIDIQIELSGKHPPALSQQKRCPHLLDS